MVFYEEIPTTAAGMKKQTIIEIIDRNQTRLEQMRQGISEVIDENRDLIRRLEEVL